MIASRTDMASSDSQSLDRCGFIVGMAEIPPVVGQVFAWQRLENGLIDSTGDMMTIDEVTNDSAGGKAIIALQTDDGAILRFIAKQ